MTNQTEYDQQRQMVSRGEFPTDSPLGKDPGEEPVPAPAPPEPQPAPEPAPQPQPQGVQLSQEEYERLQEDAESFKTIMSNHQLASLVYDYMRTGATQPRTPQTEPDPQQQAEPDPQQGQTDPAIMDRISYLEQTIAEGREALLQTQRELAKMTLRDFSKENPHFERVKSKVLNRMKEHPTLSLKDATALVVAEEAASGSQNGQPPGPTVTQSVEGKNTGTMPVDHSDPREAAAKQIHEAKSFDEAFQAALSAAKQLHGA